jgi:MinD-like ATPase involved in chromosome partitioning or flagellar assembly/CheY-like chemotaxis protein
MQDRSLSILLVEDNAGDARLLREMMQDAGGDNLDLTHVPNLTQASETLNAGSFDVVLLDLGLPESRGLDTFLNLHQDHPDVPIVVLSGLDDEEVAISAVQEGAQDYLVKKQISGGSLLRSVRYAVERHIARERELSQMQRGGEGGTIAFVGAKGGVGVTTTAINFATSLAVSGNNTIAVEMRGRHGTFSSLLSRSPAENISHLFEYGAGQITQDAVGSRLFRTPFGLRVLFGPQEARQEVDISPEQAAAIVEAAGAMSDYTILDIPAYPSEAGREAMRRAWRVFLVLEPEPAAIRAAEVALDALRTAGVTGQLMGAIMVNRATAPVGPNLDDVQDRLNIEVHAVIPPAAEACSAAQRSGTPVVLAQSESVYAVSMGEAADRLTAQQISTKSIW